MENQGGKLSISDLKMTGFLFRFIVMEAVCKFNTGAHIAPFNNNQPTALWVDWLASKSSVVTGQLV